MTLLRRIVAFAVDVFILSIFCLVARLLTYNTIISKYYLLITISLYYLLLPLLTNGRTFGKMVVKIKLESLTKNIKWYQILTRNFILIFLTIYPYIWIDILSSYIDNDITDRLSVVIFIYQISNFLYYIITLSKEEHLFLYEEITNTKNVSTIEFNDIDEQYKKEEKGLIGENQESTNENIRKNSRKLKNKSNS